MDNSTFASAGMTGGNRKRMWGGGSRSLGRRQPEDHYEAQIRELEQREKSLNAVLISAGAISASVAYRMMYTIMNFHTLPKPFLFAVMLSHFWQGMTSPTAAPQAPVPSLPPGLNFQTGSLDMSPLSILRSNMYWITSFMFSGNAIVLALLGKQMIRHRKESLPKGLSPVPPGLFHSFVAAAAADTMYRLFQVALVLVLLGHIDAIVVPAGLDVFVPTLVGGLLYTFGIISPIRRVP